MNKLLCIGLLLLAANVYVAAEQPKGVPTENWLPITREDLDLDVIMRVYQPDQKKMKTWKAPKAELVK